MSELTSIITVLDYSEEPLIKYMPIFSMQAVNNKIDLSILAIIISAKLVEETLTLNLIYSPPDASKKENGQIPIRLLVLKEFLINPKIDKNRENIVCNIPGFESHRSNMKFNLKNIPVEENCTYIVTLNELTKKQAEENPALVVRQRLAHYIFQVK